MTIFINNFRKIGYLFIAITFNCANAGSYEDFFEAIAHNDPATVGALLKRGFDPNSRDAKGDTGLIVASREGSFLAGEALLTAPGLEIDTLNEAGESALMMAALQGQLDWCRRLLDRGAQVNKSGWSPLHYAAAGAQTRVVELLLDRGAAIDAESPNQTTPLMMAARYGAEASADLLLARGADPRRRNDHRLSAADFARAAGREALAARLDRVAR